MDQRCFLADVNIILKKQTFMMMSSLPFLRTTATVKSSRLFVSRGARLPTRYLLTSRRYRFHCRMSMNCRDYLWLAFNIMKWCPMSRSSLTKMKNYAPRLVVDLCSMLIIYLMDMLMEVVYRSINGLDFCRTIL